MRLKTPYFGGNSSFGVPTNKIAKIVDPEGDHRSTARRIFDEAVRKGEEREAEIARIKKEKEERIAREAAEVEEKRQEVLRELRRNGTPNDNDSKVFINREQKEENSLLKLLPLALLFL